MFLPAVVQHDSKYGTVCRQGQKVFNRQIEFPTVSLALGSFICKHTDGGLGNTISSSKLSPLLLVLPSIGSVVSPLLFFGPQAFRQSLMLLMYSANKTAFMGIKPHSL